ncbi:hypothetical protein ASG76_13175 [Nocardioides sp. Soil774]|uniref:DUF305 domain-containing protein n=1 Tax=Nocardioides sp. Soil774 TaxID=1736408 RepID=UPI0007021D42|nr:DUF305 domain-containing protein [Nocardioides sp. Soil774]KRE94321.1 hypothetical protein ASG76_13175 [Nocardioides sp. Soil774]
MHTTFRALAALGLGLTLTLGTAACGDDTVSSGTVETSPTEHDDADVAFASDMVQHHAQALSMVDLTLDRPLDPEVQALAEDIRAAQAPEIETMADWLTGWGEPVPETVRDHANAGHDMGDMSDTMDDMGEGTDDMPGMMSADDMDALESASDADFQQMWLEMMVEHHEGAVEMARTEQESGRFEPAVELAGQIIESQTTEIATMRELLAG